MSRRLSWKARRRADTVRGILGSLAVLAVNTTIAAWALMITVGIAHADWWRHVPTIGYGSAWVLLFWPSAGVLLVIIAVARILNA